jgi:hypothetical protein
VSTDGGPFRPWTTVPASSLTAFFTGQSGHRYAFRSLATDAAGNVEKRHAKADSQTTLADMTSPTTAVVSATDNAATGLFTLTATGADTGGSGLAGFTFFVETMTLVDGQPNYQMQKLATVAAGPADRHGRSTAATHFQGLTDGVAHSYRFFSVGIDKAGNIEGLHPLPNDVEVSATFATAAPAVTGLAVQQGAVGRSFVRTVDLFFNESGAALESLITNKQITLKHFKLDGTTPASTPTVDLTDVLSVAGNRIDFDFGPNGILGNAKSTAGDGLYEIDVAGLHGAGSIDKFYFDRLLGDVNGDGQVSQLDLHAVAADVALAKASGSAGTLPLTLNTDVNGDGTVNSLDARLAGGSLAHKLARKALALLR